MKTLIWFLKDYDKNIVLGIDECIIFNIYLRRKDILWFSSVILLIFLPRINCYWTTFETLAEIEIDYKERQLKSAWEIDIYVVV